MVNENGRHYFVGVPQPRANWVEGRPYNQQRRLMDHVKYISDCHDKGSF